VKKILIIGSGGREHALAAHLLENESVSTVYVALGNRGMQLTSNLEVVLDLDVKNPDHITQFCRSQFIDWVLVSTDNALASGLVNELQNRGILCFGPTREAAQIESSKIFSKKLMQEFNIPTAKELFAGSWDKAKKFLDNVLNVEAPLVLKADGLALGKGVIVCPSSLKAKEEIYKLQDHSKILIEEYLQGNEVSFFYFVDGDHYLFFGAACDHKRLHDGDEGPNTGGMGAFSFDTGPELINEVNQKILKPTLEALKSYHISFHGMLFIGLMLTKEGPKVIEFNARFGDPETQCLLPLFPKGQLLSTFEAVVHRTLSQHKPSWGRLSKKSVHVVKVSYGYPTTHLKLGQKIYGLENIKTWPESLKFFSASVGYQEERAINLGGRVLGVTGIGNSLREARELAYQGLNQIHFEGEFFRKDIGCKRF
jgi:phosphoribosylamine--glycine ligase